MNRMQEYEALLQEMQELPPQLNGTARRARARQRGRRWGASLASLAGVCAAFVLAVNWLPTFARACAGVPFLRELVAAVAFSPSLSEAVAHDYAQLVDQSRTVDGVTVTVEYVVADAQQMVVFYRTSGEVDWEVDCDLEDEEGNPLTGYVVTSYTAAGDGGEDLRRLSIHFTDLAVPDTLVLKLCLWDEEENWGPYTFPIRLDPEKTAKTRTISVGQWVELDGQRLRVDRLELTPTRTALYLQADPDNSAWLKGFSFHFTGADGTVYEDLDSEIGGVGQEKGVYTYYFQSLYFVEEELTLWIDESVWLEKDAPEISLDLTDGQYAGELPAYVTSLTVEQEATSDGGYRRVIWVESATRQIPFAVTYQDGAGGEQSFSGVSVLTANLEKPDASTVTRFRYLLERDTGNTLELFPAYTWITKLDASQPVVLS